MKLRPGEVAITKSGRETTPFPKPFRSITTSIKRIYDWLIENAATEAEARGDEFNAMQFRAEVGKPATTANEDGAVEYLFGTSAP